MENGDKGRMPSLDDVMRAVLPEDMPMHPDHPMQQAAEPEDRSGRQRPGYLAQEVLDRAKADGERNLADYQQAEPAPSKYSDVVSDGGMDPRNAPAPALSYKDDPRTPVELSNAGCRCVRFGEGNPHWPCRIHAAPAQDEREFCCPKIGEPWNPEKHGRDCPAHQAKRPAQTEQQPVPVLDGWRIERSGDRIVVQQLPSGAGYSAARAGDSGIAESVLYLLADTLLAAPIAQTAPQNVPELSDTSRVPDDYRNQASGYRAGWNDCRMTTQTVQQVPPRMEMEPYQTVDRRSTNYKAGWNACRRAMLEGQPAPQPEQSGLASEEWIEHGPSKPCPFHNPYLSKVDIRLRGGAEMLGELACNHTWFWYEQSQAVYDIVAYRPALPAQGGSDE